MPFNPPLPRVRKALDAIGCEYEVHVKPTISELNEILSPPDFAQLVFSKAKAGFQQGTGDALAVSGVLFYVQVIQSRLYPSQSGRLFRHHSRYSCIVSNDRNSASSSTGL